jgi:SIR2-like domain
LGEKLDDYTRGLLFKHRTTGGFETVMSIIQSESRHTQSAENQKRSDDLTSAVAGIFNVMNRQFLHLPSLEFQNEVRYMVRAFLERFDVIFTLNQDGLLEAQYIPGFVGGRWSGCELPGTRALGPPPHIQGTREERLALRAADLASLQIHPRMQPYIKLHGSANWLIDERSGRLLILGGQKAASIAQHPLLTRYHLMFEEHINGPDAHLMIIGYGFNDEHINEAIGNAVAKGLKIFIVDVRGVDAFDKFDHSAPIPGHPDGYAERLRPSIIGESRKQLTETFGKDHGEHEYLMTFFK